MATDPSTKPAWAPRLSSASIYGASHFKGEVWVAIIGGWSYEQVTEAIKEHGITNGIFDYDMLDWDSPAAVLVWQATEEEAAR